MRVRDAIHAPVVGACMLVFAAVLCAGCNGRSTSELPGEQISIRYGPFPEGAGEPGPGDPGPGDPGPGDPDPGDPDPGDPGPGDPGPGDPDPGDPGPGDPDLGDPDPGDPGPGDPDAGDSFIFLVCNADEVLVPGMAWCIDRFEASNNGGTAQSVIDAQPWVNVSWDGAVAGCVAAGKVLCPSSVWLAACGGAAATSYPYADSYSASACNGAGSGSAQVQPTGSMPACEGGYAGIFDMSGNVFEWTADCAAGLCDIRGGGPGSGANSLTCASLVRIAPAENEDYRGFRCCRQP